uniref:Uncharacterized protein n=1 Tax=Micrurus corallinus TaxID=54390 RepID=A0A2D4EWY3_MICCO
MTDFLSRQCLLTAQTVNSIYDLLSIVINKVDCLKESFATFVRSHSNTAEGLGRITRDGHGTANSENEASGGSCFPPKNLNTCRENIQSGEGLRDDQHNYSSQTNQVTLQIYDKRVNRGR